MVFKVNVSHIGKTVKFETENEELVDKIIGDKIHGKEISQDLEGYEMEITGTSDKAGFPGLKSISGGMLKRAILTRGHAMRDNGEGLRLRKTIRGNTISTDTVQINTKVVKEGHKKFEEFAKKEETKQ
jgi:small subunit ribosomal protein S6e